MSSGARTFIPEMPASWVAAWRTNYLRKIRRKGSILQAAANRLTADDERNLRFGPAWAWWGVPAADREIWRGRDERQMH